MKILKISLLSFVLAGLVVMASSFTAKRLATVVYDYNTTFQIGDAGAPLVAQANWTTVGSLVNCAPDVFLCGIEVTTVGGFSMPAKQDIINAIRAAYEAPAGPDNLNHNQVVPILNGSSQTVANAVVKLIP